MVLTKNKTKSDFQIFNFKLNFHCHNFSNQVNFAINKMYFLHFEILATLQLMALFIVITYLNIAANVYLAHKKLNENKHDY